MNIVRWILAVLYTLAFTYAVVALLDPARPLEFGLIAGTVLTLVLSYAPGVAVWFETLSAEVKQQVNISLMIFAALMIFALSCTKLLDVGIACTLQGGLDLVLILLAGLISNQGVYSASKYLTGKDVKS